MEEVLIVGVHANRITGFQPVPEDSGTDRFVSCERSRYGLKTRDTARPRTGGETKRNRMKRCGREKPIFTPVRRSPRAKPAQAAGDFAMVRRRPGNAAAGSGRRAS